MDLHNLRSFKIEVPQTAKHTNDLKKFVSKIPVTWSSNDRNRNDCGSIDDLRDSGNRYLYFINRCVSTVEPLWLMSTDKNFFIEVFGINEFPEVDYVELEECLCA